MCQVYLKKKEGKIGVAILWDKTDFRAKKITRDINNDKKVNPPREHSNRKCVCTKQWSYKICEAKLIVLKGEKDKSRIIVETSTSLSLELID